MKLATLPEPDDAEPGLLAQSRVPHREVRQGRVARGQLRDLKAAERPDHVCLGTPDVHTISEVFAQLLLERQYGARPAQRENVDRVLLFHDRDNRHVRGYFTRRQRDVRVDGVFAVGDQQPRGCDLETFVGGAAVILAGDDPDAVSGEPDGLGGIRLDHDVGDLLGLQSLDEPGRQRIEFREHDVAGHPRGHAPRRPQADPRLEPRCIEQADEQKREHDEQQHDPRQQHHDAEQAADVGGERDVPEAQRRHHHERPVRAGDPREWRSPSSCSLMTWNSTA